MNTTETPCEIIILDSLSGETKSGDNFCLNSIQDKLRSKAKDCNLSSSEIARRSGESQSTIYRLLHSKTANPSFNLVCEVARLLKVSLMDYSFEGEESINPIHLYLGITLYSQDSSIIETNIKFEQTKFLLPIKARILDTCANEIYKPDTTVTLHPISKSLNEDDLVVIGIEMGEQVLDYFPFKVFQSHKADEWLFYAISDYQQFNHLFSLPKGKIEGESNNYPIKIIGTIRAID